MRTIRHRRDLATAQNGPSREPILASRPGCTPARSTQIGVDARNRFLVTGSEDKTVRVWELPSGRPLRTIRVPSDTGFDGRLYSLALSPDGMTIATGGWTSPDGVNTNIYFFDRESGRLCGESALCQSYFPSSLFCGWEIPGGDSRR